MSGKNQKGQHLNTASGRNKTKEKRKASLAQALRANLKRRKVPKKATSTDNGG